MTCQCKELKSQIKDLRLKLKTARAELKFAQLQIQTRVREIEAEESRQWTAYQAALAEANLRKQSEEERRAALVQAAISEEVQNVRSRANVDIARAEAAAERAAASPNTIVRDARKLQQALGQSVDQFTNFEPDRSAWRLGIEVLFNTYFEAIGAAPHLVEDEAA